MALSMAEVASRCHPHKNPFPYVALLSFIRETAPLPAVSLPQCENLCHMMARMPGIQSQRPVESDLPVFGMLECALKIVIGLSAQQYHPAPVQSIKQRKRGLDRRSFRIRQFCPRRFRIRFDERILFCQC